MSHIELRGVRVHNLKSIDFRLPLGKLIAITGVSGAGKSSLAFDTLVAEGRRRYIETFAPSARQFLERIERPDADALENLPPAVAFRAEAAFDQGATLGTMTETDDLLRMLFARLGRAYCPHCQTPLNARTPDDVCRELQTLTEGTKFFVAFPSDKDDEAIRRWRQLGFVRTIELPESQISSSKLEMLVVVDRLIAGRSDAARLLESVEQAYRHGEDRCVVLTETRDTDVRAFEWDSRKWSAASYSRRLICVACGFEFPVLEPDLLNFESSLGACSRCSGTGRIATATAVKLKRSMTSPGATTAECPDCGGSRLSAVGRSVRLSGGRTGESSDPTIVEFRNVKLSEFAAILDEFASSTGSSERVLVANVLGELSGRLRMLLDLGLGHLALNRSPCSLSRGERQRARLAGVLATRLDNALYVLDEPSGGLHPLDAKRVLMAIRRLQQAGNTVIVVEHSQAFVDAVDEVVELGPGAGREGGRVVSQRSRLAPRDESRTEHDADRADDPTTDHAQSAPDFPVAERQGDFVTIENVTLHNLDHIDVTLPLNRLCVVTGVSGSGKSSLIQHTLYPALCQRFGVACEVDPVGEFSALAGAEQLDEVVYLDSSPIRRSARASAATMLHLRRRRRRRSRTFRRDTSASTRTTADAAHVAEDSVRSRSTCNSSQT